MKASLFIAGTDTGVGKTWVTAGLVRGLRARKVDTVGMKPVASGSEPSPEGWRNEDALILLAASELPEADYGLVNPLALPMAASPHIAAAAAGMKVSLSEIERAFTGLYRPHSVVLVEGVGGWSVPLSGPSGGWCMQADLVRRLGLPVLLVVGLRLGCINHALLTAQVIQDQGFQLRGWIGNEIQADLPQVDAMVSTLTALMPAPCLGRIGHGALASPALLERVLADLHSV